MQGEVRAARIGLSALSVVRVGISSRLILSYQKCQCASHAKELVLHSQILANRLYKGRLVIAPVSGGKSICATCAWIRSRICFFKPNPITYQTGSKLRHPLTAEVVEQEGEEPSENDQDYEVRVVEMQLRHVIEVHSV